MAESSNNQPKDEKPAGESADKANKKEIEDGKAMAILAYILAPIPYFAEKKNKFVRYHAIQGMNLFIVAVAYSILASIINNIVWKAVAGNCVRSLYSGSWGGCSGGMASFVSWIIGLIGLGIGIIAIIGIINAVQGQKKELPIFGKLKIIKK
jgi:uncharacterized membrane protein